MKPTILSIFNTFLKVGVIGFGGGSALIPVVEKEVVDHKKWFTDEEYLKHTIISNITPGALPVKLGALAGYEKGGSLGSVLGAYAVTLPGVFITVLLLTLFSIAGEGVVHHIEFASVGISLFIIHLLLLYVSKVIYSVPDAKGRRINLFITLMAFLVTGGKEIQLITAGFLGKELEAGFLLFDISTIHLIIISFFMIFYAGVSEAKRALIIGSVISLVYALAEGKSNIIPDQWSMGLILPCIMFILSVYAIVKDLYQSKKKDSHGNKASFKIEGKWLRTVLLFTAIPIGLVIVSIMLSGDLAGHNAASYGKGVALSTITSFGGGEAYVTVADGFFVQTDYLSAKVFYSQVVAVANALPGPILVKIAAAVGYIFGGTTGGILYGWLLAVTGMTVAVGACCIIALIVLVGYDTLKDAKPLILLKRYILPVVAGMLLSTSLSMLIEIIKITEHIHLAGNVVLPISGAAIILMIWIHKKYHLNDLIMIIGSAGVSLGLLGFMQ